MPSIKKNIIFNYIGQLYVALAGILTLPLYLKHISAEEYGLIGFFSLLQGWMQLLDMGLSPTMGREVARMRDQQSLAPQLRSMVRSMETIFIVMAIAAGLSVFLGRHWIAQDWLRIHELDHGLTATSIGMMAIAIGFRWLAVLPRSGINAYEQQVWINFIDIILVSLRFPGSLLLIIVSRGDILLFFSYQLLIALLEYVLLSRKLHKLLPKISQPTSWFEIKDIQRVAPFSMGVAYLSGIWIFTTQLDKLLLSKVLPLAEYGFFTLTAIVAAGITTLSSPIGKAVLPRMTTLLAQDKEAEMLVLYRKASCLAACIIAPATLVLALFPEQVIYMWTGNIAAAEWGKRILPLFVIGNSLLALAAFQYYLQFSHGKLKLHIFYNTAYVAVTIPLIIYAVLNYAATGAGFVWMGCQLFCFLVWTPFIHKRFAPGMHAAWLFKDILPPFLISAALLLPSLYILQSIPPLSRGNAVMILALLVMTTTFATLLASFFSEAKEKLRAYIQN